MADTDFARVIEVAQEGVLKTYKNSEGREFVILRDSGGKQILHEVEPRTTALPGRIVQNVRIDIKDSFVDYVCAYSRGTARVFADLGKGAFRAVFDYHEAPTNPNACEHSATFRLQESEQWQRWTAISGKLMGQADFVRFLEENCADIASPAAAELHEICRDFSAKRKVDFREAVRLESGARQFEYVEEVKGTTRNGEIEVPSKFVLAIPVYYGEASTELHAFLRYNVEGGLSLGIELHRPKFIKQAVFEAVGRDIAERAGVPVHYGAAE